MRIPIAIVLMLAFYSSLAHPQVTWKQIEQPYFRLIFQSHLDVDAKAIADKLNFYFNAHLKELPLNRPLRTIDIVLQTEAQISNGFVGTIPYHSMWFNRPGAFTTLQWFDALAVHESRHIVQFNQIYDTTIGRALGFAFGDLGSGIMAFFLLPSWYLEGDAVLSETLLTAGGRGRVAAFDLWLRADGVIHDPYPYDRTILGTNFDRIPYFSPYVLGYYLTGYMQTQHGKDIFDRSLDEIGLNKGFNFNGRVRTETGLNLSAHYQNMMTTFKTKWRSQIEALELSKVTKLVEPVDDHWRSLYPVSVDDGTIALVEVDALEGYFLAEYQLGQYRRLTNLPEAVARNYYSGSKTKSVFKADGQYCWVVETPDRFRFYKESGDLYCWSLTDNYVRKTFQNNLTSGTFSQERFLVHQFNPDQSSVLLLLDDAGTQVGEFQLPKGSLAIDLAPAREGWLYVLSGTSNGLGGIYHIDVNLKESRRIKTSAGDMLRSPMMVDDWLMYTSDQSGIDQISKKSLVTGEEFQIVTRPFGSYYPVWDASNQSIVFADYAANGQQLSSMYIDLNDSTLNMELADQHAEKETFAFPSLLPDTKPALVNKTDYQINTYSRLANLWNPHSWSLFSDGDNVSGFLSSSDPLETLNLNFIVNYQTKTGVWDASVEGQYRTATGPFVVWYAQETFDAYRGYPKELGAQMIQPVLLQKGAMHYEWLPGLGTAIKHQYGKLADPYILASLSFFALKDKPLQAIRTPLFFEQSISGLIPTGDGANQFISHTEMDIRGFTPRQNVNVQVDAQQKPASAEPLLTADNLFTAPNEAGLTVQTQMNYQMNLGPVGKPVSSLLFWRNTEVSANLRRQQSANVDESAIGLSVQPNMNVFRNDRLIIEPRMSVFYHLQRDVVSVTWSVKIAGN